jgi:lipopolysaccharide/colanic/teichoic acid biosynthesis glycosyltransferase
MKLQYLVKRAFDYAVASTALVVCAPAMAAIAIAIKLDSDGPVFYVQRRLGREGREFDLLKFRTMRDAPIRYNADGSTRVDANDDRVTRVGRHLRGALDELPQLINILRGEMSFVGPRPDMASQRALYQPSDERKLSALPGLTSLAIVHGRNDLPWKQRIEIDSRYVEHWSLALDARIVAATLLMPLGYNIVHFEDVLGASHDS